MRPTFRVEERKLVIISLPSAERNQPIMSGWFQLLFESGIDFLHAWSHASEWAGFMTNEDAKKATAWLAQHAQETTTP